MHNKFSNCFVWVSPSTSDLEFHLMSYKIQAPIIWQDFTLKNTELPNKAAVLKWRLILRLAGNVGISDQWGKPKPFSNDCLVTENQKSIANSAIFWTFSALSCAGAILKNRPVCFGTSRLKSIRGVHYPKHYVKINNSNDWYYSI